MTAFHSSPRMLGQKQDKFWLTVGLCALTAALIFLPFYLLDGGFFHYAGDFNSQQISFYRYMNGFLKGLGYPDGAGSVHNTFSWATDLGSGALNAYSFYLYGSPFFWFSLLFPQRWLPYLMVPLLVLKFAVAGGGAYLYLRRYVKEPNYAVLGAVLYAFSGWGLYNIFFNHFIDVLALFPWMLWALDEAVYHGRHGLFAFWVGVNLLNNYFFFVGQVLFLLLYFICKVSAGDFKLTPRLFVHLAFESLLGVGLGAVILWPAVLSLLQNPRTIDLSSGWGFLTYAKPQQYLAILHRHQRKGQRGNDEPADVPGRAVQLDGGVFQCVDGHGGQDEHRHIEPPGVVAGIEGIEGAVQHRHQRKDSAGGNDPLFAVALPGAPVSQSTGQTAQGQIGGHARPLDDALRPDGGHIG